MNRPSLLKKGLIFLTLAVAAAGTYYWWQHPA
ncbi:hypothetical protein EIO60_00881|nr:hypothetical protein [Candidatus Pantoea persica]